MGGEEARLGEEAGALLRVEGGLGELGAELALHAVEGRELGVDEGDGRGEQRGVVTLELEHDVAHELLRLLAHGVGEGAC